MLEFSQKADQGLQTEINGSILFNTLRERGPASRAELAKKLKLSASAVSRVVGRLIADGYVVETGKVRTAVGKRPTGLEVNSRRHTVVAVDLSQDSVKLGLFDFAGRLLARKEGSVIRGKREEIDLFVREVEDFIAAHSSEHGITRHGLALGVGIPADVDLETGKITGAPLYEEWGDLNFRDRFHAAFGAPVFVKKDVSLSVLAETARGQGKGFSDVVFVEVSSGVSAGIMIDGQLVRGSSGSAGQIAFSILELGDLDRKTGTQGNLDRSASVHSLRESAIRALSQGEKGALRAMAGDEPEGPKPASVCRAALAGDRAAERIIDEASRRLAVGILNLVIVVNPQVIVLGGAISDLPGVDRLFVDRIRGYVANAVPFRLPEIRISSLGEDVVLIGAAELAIQWLVAGKFPYKMRH
jgi:predicted NBD/HSP70 family sugar kinase